jgi:hypothetical protein
MVLLFDMVFSLLASVTVPVSKQWDSGFIPGTDLNASNFAAAYGWNSGHTSE